MLMPEPSLHRIAIDEKWSLVDLYEFPHTYTHVYAFIYSLTQTGRLSEAAVAAIYRRHPWRGGYSAVNFYGDLYYAMEEEHQPMVSSIRYASPGFIEIAALVGVATQVEKVVKVLAKCVDIADATYDRIHKRAQKRKLLSLSVKRREQEFRREELEFMVESSKDPRQHEEAAARCARVFGRRRSLQLDAAQESEAHRSEVAPALALGCRASVSLSVGVWQATAGSRS